MIKKQDTKKEIEFFNSFDMDEYDSFPQETFGLISGELKKLNLEGLGLEAGCGLASFGRKLIETNKNISLVGVDINRKFVNEVNKMRLSHYEAIYGNLEEKELFKNNQFDFAIFPYVLHHIPDIQKIMENTYFWLKPNGKLIILEPNGLNPVLNLSFALRIFFQRFFKNWVAKYASPNEKNISLNEFKRVFGDLFKILTIKPFLINLKFHDPSHFDIIFQTLAEVRIYLLKLCSYFPVSQYWGSDILLIAQKK